MVGVSRGIAHHSNRHRPSKSATGGMADGSDSESARRLAGGSRHGSRGNLAALAGARARQRQGGLLHDVPLVLPLLHIIVVLFKHFVAFVFLLPCFVSDWRSWVGLASGPQRRRPDGRGAKLKDSSEENNEVELLLRRRGLKRVGGSSPALQLHTKPEDTIVYLAPDEEHPPELDQPSAILTADHVHALAAALPARHRLHRWSLTFSTHHHGFSLGTLYRRSPEHGPCVLVVQDMPGHVFGAYCSEAWHVRPRYFGTGETFVFQLEPKQIAFKWQQKTGKRKVPNEFFQLAFAESLALGGSPAFALWLDSDLREGHSNNCGTFGSPCLASSAEFAVRAVELWRVEEPGKQNHYVPHTHPHGVVGSPGGPMGMAGGGADAAGGGEGAFGSEGDLPGVPLSGAAQ
ncbi:unnamed protein product [Pedinophyceae sp. YPF-701]|nr:unnamed protein product [Pedinophyceae sp. YPF-701]